MPLNPNFRYFEQISKSVYDQKMGKNKIKKIYL